MTRRRRLDKYDESVRFAVEALRGDPVAFPAVERAPKSKPAKTPKTTAKTRGRRPSVGDRVRLPTGHHVPRWDGRPTEARVVATYPKYALVEFAAGYREAWHYTDLEVIG